MSAGNHKFTINQGATFSRTIDYKNPAGAAIDLSTSTAKMSVKKAYGDATSLIDLTTANSRIVLDDTLPNITLSLTSTLTAALPAGLWVYDLEVYTGAAVDSVIRGTFLVLPEVSV